jgi:hypothetical protein
MEDIMKKDNIYGFDYKQEIKEYTALCKNKRNRKYKNYLDWKKHIIENLDGMNMRTLENFLHLCLYQEKLENRGIEVFMPLSLGVVSLYLSQLIVPENNVWGAAIGYTAVMLVVIASIIQSYFSYVFPKDFYHDVAEITQEYINAFPEDEKKLLIAVKEIEVRK